MGARRLPHLQMRVLGIQLESHGEAAPLSMAPVILLSNRMCYQQSSATLASLCCNAVFSATCPNQLALQRTVGSDCIYSLFPHVEVRDAPL